MFPDQPERQGGVELKKRPAFLSTLLLGILLVSCAGGVLNPPPENALHDLKTFVAGTLTAMASATLPHTPSETPLLPSITREISQTAEFPPLPTSSAQAKAWISYTHKNGWHDLHGFTLYYPEDWTNEVKIDP